MRSRGRGSRLGVLLLVAAAAVPLSGCFDKKDQAGRSLCSVFEQYLEARVKVSAIKPEDKTASQAAEVVEKYQALLERLGQVTDDRYGQAVDELSLAVDDLLRTLQSAPDDADYSTWKPLVKDSLEDVRDAVAHLEDLIKPDCKRTT